MGFKLFGGRKGKRDKDETVAMEARPAQAAPPETLEIERPLDGLSVTFLFPLAFQVGEVPVRARPLRLLSGSAANANDPAGPWFFWKADTAAGSLSAYWRLPGPPEKGIEAADWSKTAHTLAAAAASQVKAVLSARAETKPTLFSAGPCKEPDLQGKRIFRADFRYAARGAFREGNAYASVRFPGLLARAYGCADETNADDPIGSMVAVSDALRKTSPGLYWVERAFKYPGTRKDPYLPVYELLNLLSDGDAQLLMQNYLLIKAQGPSLGALFLYRGSVRTPNGIRERVIAPHSFDPQRIYPYLPASVFEDGRLAAANAAENLDDFLLRNDEAYEGLFQALRKDALALSPEGSALVRAVYLSQVYSAKRRDFDELVQEGKPFDEFRALPEAIARRAVDTSGPEAIAAGIYGSTDALAFVARWCSRRKREAIAEELERLGASLREGRADISALMAGRRALNDKAAAIIEAERRTAGAGRGRTSKN